MINTTAELQFLTSGQSLHRATANATATAVDLLKRQAVPFTRPSDMRLFAFARLFKKQDQNRAIRFDKAFLHSALEFCQSDSRHTNARKGFQIIQAYAKQAELSGTAWPGIKRGLKLMLVELWRQQALLLPTVFTPGTHFPWHYFDHKLLAWIQRLDASVASESGGMTNALRIRDYGTRLLLTADWKCPKDVSLRELASLHRAQVHYRLGKSDVVIAGGVLPFSLFAVRLQKAFPKEVPFTAEELARYSVWALTHSIDAVPFEEFSPLPKTKKSHRKANHAVKYDCAALVADAAHQNTHASILNGYRSLQRGRPKAIDWRATESPTYPGREHVDIAPIAVLWIDTFRAFLHHREHTKEYRSSSETVASINLLADYLFFYLPWWKQSFPLSKVTLPSSPREFSRYAFVARHTDVPLEELPVPLLRLIALRRPKKDSAYVAIHQLTKYFEFVETQFSEDGAMAGHGFTSPINKSLDAPRLRKKNKTTKEIIPRKLYGHLLFYCYAVEEFGHHLQKLAREARLPYGRGELRSAQRFTCAEFGHQPAVKYRGKEIKLDTVPNVFNWAERQIDADSAGKIPFTYVPHLTVLRVLIASLETGLRCQSIQWLDRFSWDSLNSNASPGSYTYALLINTDKTRENAWTTYIVWRVRELLRREQNFQESFADASKFNPVNYEGLDRSPFEPIRPLFRAPFSAYPVGDNAYAHAWKRLMIDFDAFCQATTGEQHVQMCRLQPRLNADGTPMIQFWGRNQTTPYCPISILAIHTPHACRATFATNRQGVLELSDVADLLGHQSVVVTAYYTKPSGEALQARLQESDNAIVADYAMFDASADVHIRADRPESALVQSFSRDRKGTLQRFRFMPSMALWSTKDTFGEGEGLRQLMEGPMSHIRFRETHICPVGEECPSDIVEQIGAPRRCGACPLAMKCIDHLPAIAAKKNQLLERIKYLHRRRSVMEAASEPTTALDEVWEELELDVNELLGWQLSEEVLMPMHKEDTSGETTAGNVLYVDRPEFVRGHLQRATRSCSSTEFLLQRIADSNAYPTLSSPQIQAAAAQLKRKLLAGRNADAIETWTNDLEDVKSVAQMLSLMMKSAGMTMNEVSTLLSRSAFASLETVLLPRAEHG